MSAERVPAGRSQAEERPGALPIDALARVLGAYVWAERRAYEVVGAFAADTEEPAAAVLFDTTGRHHAWHAGLFAELLPLLPGVDHDALTAPPTPEAARLFDALAATAGAPGRLAGLARVVLPRLLGGYRAHLAAAAPVADGPVARALRLVVEDEAHDLVEAERLLGRVTSGRPDAAEDAGAAEQDLSAGPAGTGGGFELWPA